MSLWFSIYLEQPLSGDSLSQQTEDARKQLERVALAILQYTPELALFDTSSLVLNAGASLTLFKGPRRLYKRMHATLAQLQVQARIGMAPTSLGAWLLARQTQTPRRRVLSRRSLTRLLDDLSLLYLPAANPFLDWLTDLGCSTLGQLVRLPRSGLAQRTSSQLIQELDAAYGKTSIFFEWYQTPEVFDATCELGFHTSNSHAILGTAERLIQPLCGWLQVRQWAASMLEFSLHHEKGRHARPPSQLVLRLSEPDWHADKFMALLAEHLGHLDLDAPVISLQLHNVQTHSRHSQPDTLFPDPAQAQRQESQLFDLLCARLGQQHVLEPSARASYLPEHVNQWVPLGHAGKNTVLPEPQPKTQRPFWLFSPTTPLATLHDQPLYQGQVLRLIQGPERIESGWWVPGQHEQRDYFVASDAAQCRYWIYRERGTENPRWFLQGLFA